MRLTTLTGLVFVFLLILILLFPALFLESTATVIPEDYQQSIGSVLASISTMTARPMTAVAVYDYFIARGKDSADIYRLKTDALLAAGDKASAMNSLDKVIERDPENPVLLIEKARLLLGEGKTAEANGIFNHVLSIQTDNPEYLAAIADIALGQTRYLEAYDRYSRSLTGNPGNGLTWEKRSDVIFALLTIPTAGALASKELKKTDLYAEGIKGYENALSLRPDRAATIKTKIEKRSADYVAKTIDELQSRYNVFRYLRPGEKPLP